MKRRVAAAVALLSCAYAAQVHAQGSITDPPAAGPELHVTAEISNDERRRGLSWSGGRAVAAAEVAATAGSLDAGVRLTTLRGAARHGGADAVADLSLGTGTDIGGWRIDGGAVAHLFAGARGQLDYGELTISTRYAYGPALLDAGVDYAPEQAAIGGDNLHWHAGLSGGVPGTPLTLATAIGRTTGGRAESRGERLRPGGDYTDWRVGAQYVRDRLTLTIAYTGTDLHHGRAMSRLADRTNAGDRLIVGARFRL